MAFGPLVETRWLVERLGEPGLRVVDARWRLGDPEAGERLYSEGHIPGAGFLDVERELSGPAGPAGRHPLPDAHEFEHAARSAGIDADSWIVAYDDGELGGAARLWWLLRHFGHDRVAVLNGGLAAWAAAGGKLETCRRRRHEPGPHPFVARPRVGDTAGAEELLSGGAEAILDARAPERYRGETEPIDPVAGHIPGARNVPFAELVPGGRYPPPEVLRQRLPADGFVAYCGSGVTACTLLVAAEAAGIDGARLYPGSWSEWSGRGLPAERS